MDNFVQSYNIINGFNSTRKVVGVDETVLVNILIANSTKELTVNFPNLLNSLFNETSIMISNELSKNYTFCMVLIIVFIVSLSMIYLIYLCQTPSKVKSKVIMTIRLLSIIPPRIIADIPSIRNYLNNSSI